MRIAIVGAGVSGLVCAALLHPEHEITVLEAGPRPGGHANTVDVELDDGTFAVDTGFVVYNDRNYPLFSSLLESLGVATEPTEMSFSVCDPQRRLEYRTTSIDSVYARRSSLLDPSHSRMVIDIVRFSRRARRLLGELGPSAGVPGSFEPARAGRDARADATLGEMLAAGRYGERLREDFVVPLSSAIWSADPRRLDEMPFATWARFFDNHGLLSFGDQPRWRTVSGGSRRYVEALTRPFAHRIRLGCAVDKLVRHRDGVELHLASGSSETYDHVVLATHSDTALSLLGDPSPREHDVLGAIRYQENLAVLHTDERLLPRRRRAWASWNYQVHGGARATLSYHMSRLQHLRSRHQLLVTLNRDEAIDPARVLASFEYAHPVLDAPAVRAQSRRFEIQGLNRTWYCGASWGYGFHEDGVRSAYELCNQLRSGAAAAATRLLDGPGGGRRP